MKISMIPNKIVKLIHASKGDTSLRKWAFEPYDNNGAINVSNIKDQLVYKTENGGTEQLLPVNTSTPTTSYFDGTINYGTDTDVEFTYKQSSYTGQARIKSIKGNTLVWNQLVQNGNFASSSGWPGGSNTTISVSNNVLTATPTDSSVSGNRFIRRGETYSLPAGHKLFISFRATSTSGSVNLQYVKSSPWTVIRNKVITLSTSSFTQVTDVFELTDELNLILFNFDGKNDLQLSNVWMTDLTQAYGSGNEPTSDQFTSLFSLPYYAYGQYLLNFNGSGIKTTGKNLCDISNASTPSNLVSKVGDVLHFAKNTTAQWDNKPFGWFYARRGERYTISTDTFTYGRIGLAPSSSQSPYDTSHSIVNMSGSHLNSVISYEKLQNSVNPDYEGIIYLWYCNDRGITTLANAFDTTIQIEFGSSATSYEPYTSSTLSLPISTYFPTGMKSAGSVYDELSDKAITRVGSVDLGSLTWNYAGGRFQSTDLNGLIHDYTTLESPNITCAKYPTFIANYTSQTTFGITAFKDSGVMYLRVLDSAYSDSATFKTAMSGVYLNYELATYTETDIQNASLVCKNIEVPCYLSSGNLVCDATEELTNESGFFDAKLKLKDSSSVAYSSKFKLHVEDL